MSDMAVHLNPKYGGLKGDEPWRFHPYSNNVVNDNEVKQISFVAKEPSRTSWIFVLFILSIVALLQSVLAVGSYSGEGKPPMFGDFEAQRHWMELTYHLPVQEWYVNGTNNDLLYWGLDYPPLTAYHSYIMGLIAHIIDPSWVSLHLSRGIETAAHKLYMRITAALPFYILYVPSVLLLIFCEQSKDLQPHSASALMLLYPGLLAIDNAHFQYNSISLGLFLLSFILLTRQLQIFGSISFVLALNYKQMELYHALPIFVFILSRCLKRPLQSRLLESIASLAKVAVAVLFTFGVLWFPLLRNGSDVVRAALSRIFPFYRGLFEDKVASVWCAFSFMLQLNKRFSLQTQIKISAVSVFLAIIPSLLILFLRPSVKKFKLSLMISSLSFFLFSFQVHEKSILLAAIPAMLLLPQYPVAVVWLLHITNTSMFSLCVKDGTTMLLFVFLTYYVMCSYFVKVPGKLLHCVYHLSCFGAIIVCIAEWTLTPPLRYPHIFPLLNAVYSCFHYLLFLSYFNFEIIRDEYDLYKKKKT